MFLLLGAVQIPGGGGLFLVQGDVHPVFLSVVHDHAKMALQDDAEALGELFG